MTGITLKLRAARRLNSSVANIAVRRPKTDFLYHTWYQFSNLTNKHTHLLTYREFTPRVRLVSYVLVTQSTIISLVLCYKACPEAE